MTAKEYLEKAYRLNQVIDIKLEEVSALRSLTTRVTTAFGEDKIKTSKKRSPMEDVLVRLMDLENEVNIDIDRLISLKKEIIETINQVDDYTLRLVLAMRYINHKSWEDIADDLLYDVRTIYRFHKQGLKEIEKILNLSVNITKCQ
jgi:DNA-directed RNA polymerase specialized sigma subunit